ncbi:hypothetical protein N3K66_005803 [Trichothecium roseum]|uniref:Uncharacterized protein n=1 Tax=Trichothecium roseum TaxID=47278 RepID=A0ACC0V0S5_9HYPO|nr:hypothetical protein N3K66_005803 [Trichothecium roseum]
MLFQSALVALASVASVACKEYSIDPETVDITDREYWCATQTSTCPMICDQMKPGTTDENECDAETLQYQCVCGDNKTPNMSEYSLTIPYFVCREWGNQCVTDCSDDTCRSACREDNPCGALNPTRANTTSSLEPTASQTDDPNAIYTRPGGGDDDDDSSAMRMLSATNAMYPWIASLGVTALIAGML